MSVQSVAVGKIPPRLPPGLGLLVLASPTHDYGLPRWRSRRQAEKRGGYRAETQGTREWIAGLEPDPWLKVVAVDTALQSVFTPSTAAKAAAHLLLKAGFRAARRGPTFYVGGYSGPLLEGEAARAQSWATQLAAGLAAARHSAKL
jgi:hypothetical protein